MSVGQSGRFNISGGGFGGAGIAGIQANLMLALPADQSGLAANTVINLRDDIVGYSINNNMVYNNTTNTVTLKANYTYKLVGGMRIYGTASWCGFAWWDVTNSMWLGTFGIVDVLDSSAPRSNRPNAVAIVSPLTDIDVQLRITSLSGTPTIWASSYATVEAMGGVDYTPFPVIQSNLLVGLSATQSNVNAGTIIEFLDNVPNISIVNNITFDNVTHEVTLLAGYTYKLQAFMRHSTSGVGSDYRWYDVTNGIFIGTTGGASSPDIVSGYSSIPVSTAVIKPTIDIKVRLECTFVSTSNIDITNNSHAIVEIMGGVEKDIITNVSLGPENFVFSGTYQGWSMMKFLSASGLTTDKHVFVIPFNCTLVAASGSQVSTPQPFWLTVYKNDDIVYGNEILVMDMTGVTEQTMKDLNILLNEGDVIHMYSYLGATDPALNLFFERRG